MFKPEFIGNDLFLSLISLLNRVKSELTIPKFIEYGIIHTVYKEKGNKLDLSNDRGIFIVNVFRSIPMKLVYNDVYSIIDYNMSDSNVGGRKKKVVRNNIFIIIGIINEAIITKNKAIDLQIMDYSQCFDTLSLQDCINDLYDVGVTDDKLALIHKVN